MPETRQYGALKIGLFVTAIVWFLFSFHELFKATVNIAEYQFFSGPSATYFDVIYIMWLLLGSLGGWSGWFVDVV